MLRNIPTACDFSFTATWLAGRLPAFRSTVPEMIPSVRSEVGACAFAVGAHTNAVMVPKRMGKNPTLRYNFFAFCNLHSISTCCALLRRSLGRLGGCWGQSVTAANSHFQQSFRAAVVVSPARIAPFTLDANRRVRGPMPQFVHCACHNAHHFIRCRSRRLKMPGHTVVAMVLRRHLLFFHRRVSGYFSSEILFCSHLSTSPRSGFL